MRILLVHRNYPGQFRSLGPALVKAGHKVAALTWEKNRNPRTLPQITYKYDLTRMPELADTYREYANNGAAAARAAQALRDKSGEVPDVVFGIINWGETLFLKEVWPEARHLGYAEFLYATKGLDTGFDPEFRRSDFAAKLRITARKAHLIQAAVQADALMAPTAWQASTFPAEIRAKMSVIHDGVDTDAIAPDPGATYQVPGGPLLRYGDEVITFVNRVLEPYRGFHIFMRALPKLLAARPNARVVLVGGEKGGYGPSAPDNLSWRQVMLAELDGKLDLSRLHFTGRIPYPDLLDLLRVGRAHVYMSYPFVLSWSMLEAMSLGAYVIGSATPPVQEVITDGQNGRLVDFFDVDALSDALIDAMSNPSAQAPIRAAARQHIIDTYDLKSICLPRLIDFVETAGI